MCINVNHTQNFFVTFLHKTKQKWEIHVNIDVYYWSMEIIVRIHANKCLNKSKQYDALSNLYLNSITIFIHKQ